jgi:hypothetical protein
VQSLSSLMSSVVVAFLALASKQKEVTLKSRSKSKESNHAFVDDTKRNTLGYSHSELTNRIHPH